MRIKERAKDPASVQLQDVEAYRRGDTIAVCGQYNAKNGFGGYAGFKTFVHVGETLVTEEDARTLGAAAVNRFIALCRNAQAPGQAP